ncbi:MAG: sigma-70 family RNA polymerase sigma factor [Prevotella sp.]|nr:sigma-70 family RNA polymerase sigma factor [Prevotella sp.]
MLTDQITAKEFEELFRKNYTRYYYFAYDFLEQEEESRDVVAEAFMSVWKNHANVERDKLQSYLFTSIRNKCITQLGKHKRVCRLSDEMIHALAAETETEWLEREERISKIEQELDNLSDRTRYVLEQCYYQHRSYRDVATELGITTDGVKKHITTALKQLRAKFNTEKQKN